MIKKLFFLCLCATLPVLLLGCGDDENENGAGLLGERKLGMLKEPHFPFTNFFLPEYVELTKYEPSKVYDGDPDLWGLEFKFRQNELYKSTVLIPGNKKTSYYKKALEYTKGTLYEQTMSFRQPYGIVGIKAYHIDAASNDSVDVSAHIMMYEPDTKKYVRLMEQQSLELWHRPVFKKIKSLSAYDQEDYKWISNGLNFRTDIPINDDNYWLIVELSDGQKLRVQIPQNPPKYNYI